MILISDVHGAFEAMRRVAASGETLLVLGDFVNLMDYRTGEGITADLLGIDFARKAARARAAGDYRGMRSMWAERVGDRWEDFRQDFDAALLAQYAATREALAGSTAYVTYGNVDRPRMLRDHLPDGVVFVDGDVVEIEGLRVGFVGGGISTPLGAEGEVSDEEMAAKLEGLGAVDVLCSHLPPAVEPLHRDVITGRLERASVPILEFLLRTRPRYHFFGDVHQPQATTWMVGTTMCRNVGYFRATERAVRFDPQ
ncbi:MAG: metallophosphoesterase [Acidimicrobiia bacterium]|nr:metallophosphoesterase [Acidimicrobiia bacterium]MDH5293648.1 metallophosphoesterase [Acidimicrobiia bacterium]